MYKVLGIVSVVSASVLAGFFMANELNQRTKLLKEIHQCAIYIKSEIEYRMPPLSECFKGRGQLFSVAYNYINNENLLPQEALVKASEDLKLLNETDKSLITSFAQNSAAEDVNGQISNINWLISAIEERILQAENESRTKGRLYRSSGALAGAGLVILLM